MDDIASHALLALALPYIFQWLKGQSWFRFLSFTGGWMNRVTVMILAALPGLGIDYMFDSATGHLIVTGLVWATIWPALQHLALQWVGQHYVYTTSIAPRLPGFTQAAMRSAEAAGTPVVPATEPQQ